jgi:hypothetical protein
MISGASKDDAFELLQILKLEHNLGLKLYDLHSYPVTKMGRKTFNLISNQKRKDLVTRKRVTIE